MSREWLNQVNQRVDLARAQQARMREAERDWGDVLTRLQAAYCYLHDQFPAGSPQWSCYGHVAMLLRVEKSLAELEECLHEVLETRREMVRRCLPQDKEHWAREVECYQQVLADMHLAGGR